MTGRNRVFAFAFVILSATGCVGSSDGGDQVRPRPSTTTRTPPPPAGCEGRTQPPAGQSGGTIAFGGLDRTYLLHTPAGYDGSEPVPVVFNFHGHGSSAAAQIIYADFRPLSERDGFLLVAPDGQGSPRHFTLLGAANGEADDVEFAVALLDKLDDELCVDPRRVFATGMSNGGALASVLACRASERFAAVGAVAAMIFIPPCAEGGRPAPIVAMMGTADPVVPFAGGRVNCCGNPSIPAAPDTMVEFAARSGCAEPTETRPAPSILRRAWPGCEAGSAVEFYAIEGGGHTWPGAAIDLSTRGLGETTKDLVATEVLWAFFEDNPRPVG